MKSNFGLYSQYYDLLYADKDYLGEVSYLFKLISKYGNSNFTSLLELGCGTGMHATLIGSRNINVCGVDMSNDMLERAISRAQEFDSMTGQLSFFKGDVRTFRVEKYFDVVASLFHVTSYQVEDEDVLAMLETASAHLKSGGLFIFDFWYGPAVLSQSPSVRLKKLNNDQIEVSRIAQPTLYENKNIVEVNYNVYIKDVVSGEIQIINETHVMRYLFLPEVKCLLMLKGFEMVKAEEWMTSIQPSVDTWGVCIVAKKI
jgi:SAM-dependent methyltransferase